MATALPPPPGPASASEPLVIRGLRSWLRDLRDFVRSTQVRGDGRTIAATQTPGGTTLQVLGLEPNGPERPFRGYLPSGARTGAVGPLHVQGGHLHCFFNDSTGPEGATVDPTDITLPSSGDLYVYVTATWDFTANTLTAVIATGTAPPTYYSGTVINFPIGWLEDTGATLDGNPVYTWHQNWDGDIPLLDGRSDTFRVTRTGSTLPLKLVFKHGAYVGTSTETTTTDTTTPAETRAFRGTFADGHTTVSSSGPLRIAAGEIRCFYHDGSSEDFCTVAAADITLPGAGTTYVWVTATWDSGARSLSGAVSSGSVYPDYYGSGSISFPIGYLTALGGGLCQWVQKWENDIALLDGVSQIINVARDGGGAPIGLVFSHGSFVGTSTETTTSTSTTTTPTTTYDTTTDTTTTTTTTTETTTDGTTTTTTTTTDTTTAPTTTTTTTTTLPTTTTTTTTNTTTDARHSVGFNGSTQYLTRGGGSWWNETDDFSVCGWFKNTSGDAFIIAAYNTSSGGYQAGLLERNSGNWRWSWYDTGHSVHEVSVGISTTDFVVFGRRSGKMFISVNGAAASETGVLSSLYAPENLVIGARDYGSGVNGYWGGWIDKLLVFNYGLSDANCTTLYNSGAGYNNDAAPLSPVTGYDFDGSLGDLTGYNSPTYENPLP